MPKLTDQRVLGRLIKHYGTGLAVQRALGLPNHQTVFNWQARGIAGWARPAVWVLANKVGIKLDHAWLLGSTAKHKGNGHGGKSAKPSGESKKAKAPKRKGKRSRQGRQQPRARSPGRNVPAVAS